MSQIKKHYMRAKRKRLQEEVFFNLKPDLISNPEPGPSKITRFSSESTNISILPTNINIPTNDTQAELSENNNLESDFESDLFLRELDKSSEYLSLSFHSSSDDSVGSDTYKYFPHDSIEENTSEENIKLNLIQWSLTHTVENSCVPP